MAYETSQVAPSSAKQSLDQSAAQEITGRLAAIHEHLSSIVDRSQRVVDRAFGASPNKEAGVQPRPVPSGELGVIRERLDDIYSLTSQQLVLLNRIDTIV